MPPSPLPSSSISTTTTITPSFATTAPCFKCAGKGRIQTKQKRPNPRHHNHSQPPLPLPPPPPPPITILSHGTKSKQILLPCPVCHGQGTIPSTKKQQGSTSPGIITTPQRPPNFQVRGPLPPPLSPSFLPPHGEALCCLTGAWRIFQPMGGHRYSTDDVVTAWVAGREVESGLLSSMSGAAGGEGLKGLDLGCGLGSVLLMMSWQLPQIHYQGVEAQSASVERARRSILVNGCEERAQVRHGDIRELPPEVASSTYGIITGTPPYFDAHGAPLPSNNKDPPINVTSLPPPPSSPPSSSSSTATTITRTKAGKPRLQPVPLPAAEDQRPCNFEMRGGVEVYMQAAQAVLAPGGVFVMCASDLPGVEARVTAAAAEARLVVLRKVQVLPKEGKPSLFAVYTMCHQEGAEGMKGRLKRLVVGEMGGKGEESSRYSRRMMRETLAVREAFPTTSKIGTTVHGRTAAYRRLLHDMCMPDNELTT